MNKRISVIMPCYNLPEDLVSRALDSIMEQSFTDFEVIVIDDGSNAECHRALEHCVSKYHSVKLITTPNNGVSEARNTGVRHASGEYIAFVDGDDYVSKYYLQEAYDAMQRTDADYVIGGSIIFSDPNKILPDTLKESVEYLIYRDEDIRELYSYLGCLQGTMRFENSYLSRTCMARLLKKTIAESTPFHRDLCIGEDGIWNLEILAQCSCVCIAKSQWYYHWHNPNSAMNRYDPDMLSASTKYQEAAAQLLNLENDREYLIYIYGLYDHLRNIRRSTFSYENDSNRQLCKEIKRKLYTEYPWIEIKEKRFFRICPTKYKYLSILYRLHLLFFYWNIRAKLSRK